MMRRGAVQPPPTPPVTGARTRAATRESPRPLLSVEEAAELLGQSRSATYRAIEKGDLPLPVFRISGRYRIPRRAVELLLEGVVVGTALAQVSPEPRRRAGRQRCGSERRSAS